MKTATNSKEKKFKLVFPALPNSPKYDLDKELKIGKSEGDIVLNNDSLSPVHATVTHRDGMIFILDHKSASGTTVNGQKIPSGKNIILDEKDQIQLGSVQMRVMVVEHEIDPEEVPPPSPVEVRVDKTFKIDLAALQQNQPKSTQKEAPEVKKIITKKKKFKFKFPSFSSDDDRGANALIRFIGLVIDACIAMGIANILDGNEELGKMINDIEMLVREQVDIVYGGFLEPSLQSVSFVSDAIKELFAFLNQEFSFVRVLVLTGVLRFAFTLFVGVTLGQLLVGIRSSGHFIWKRVGGVLREIVGIVTGPLLLFDLPALISKKTFKEVLTQTKITCPSTVRSVFYIVLFLPLGAGFFIVSPLMRGGEIEEPILTQFKEYQVETSAVENKISSRDMRLSLDVSDKWWIWPQINKIKKEENILYDPELRIMSKNLPSVDLELSQFKKINLDSMFANALAHNFMLQEQFADLSNFIASKKVENQNIKPSMNQSLVEKNKMDLIKTSYDLTLMKWIENPMKYSFLPKGLIELRHSLLQVIGQNESSEARFLKVGNKYFYHTQLTGISPIDVYVPLNSGENRSYQVKNLGKNPMENQKFFESEFLTLMKVDESMMESVLPETPNVLSVMDVLENISLAEIDEIKHTHIMSFYITQSKEILNSVQDQEGVRIAFLQSIDNILKFLLLFKEKLGVSELHLKLSELSVALTNKELEYFETVQPGLTPVPPPVVEPPPKPVPIPAKKIPPVKKKR